MRDQTGLPLLNLKQSEKENGMEIRINKSAITQYLLIYLMFIIPGSCLFAKYWTGTMKYFVLLIVYAALIAFKNKYQSRYSICFLLLLLFRLVSFVRCVGSPVISLEHPLSKFYFFLLAFDSRDVYKKCGFPLGTYLTLGPSWLDLPIFLLT